MSDLLTGWKMFETCSISNGVDEPGAAGRGASA
jgi:hypothetical protein